jgi:hypothetical protein
VPRRDAHGCTTSCRRRFWSLERKQLSVAINEWFIDRGGFKSGGLFYALWITLLQLICGMRDHALRIILDRRRFHHTERQNCRVLLRLVALER